MDKIICECGSKYTEKSKIKHFGTNKHINFLEKNGRTDEIMKIVSNELFTSNKMINVLK
jgi:hypothetical protein